MGYYCRPPPPTKPMTMLRFIKAAEILKYFNDKGINATCLRCGMTSWELTDTPHTRGVGGPILSPEGVPTQRYRPIIHLFCKNCGTTWDLERAVVEKVIASGDDKTSESDS